MAAATGLKCRVDPALVMALKAQKSGKTFLIFSKGLIELDSHRFGR